jgi:effector-binding domain-containing protein
MPYHCEINDRPAQFVVAVRTRTPFQNLPQAIGEAFGELMPYLARQGEGPVGPPFTAYHNEDMQDMDIEIGIPVARPLAGEGRVQPSKIEGGKAVVCLHVGPYDQLKVAYEAIMQWMTAGGHQYAMPCYEFYLNDPCDTPPERLQTQIVIPVKSPS